MLQSMAVLCRTKSTNWKHSDVVRMQEICYKCSHSFFSSPFYFFVCNHFLQCIPKSPVQRGSLVGTSRLQQNAKCSMWMHTHKVNAQAYGWSPYFSPWSCRSPGRLPRVLAQDGIWRGISGRLSLEQHCSNSSPRTEYYAVAFRVLSNL